MSGAGGIIPRGGGSGVNPYAFIVGCPRSGTTLLRRLVEAHSEIAMPRRETHWIPECFYRRKGVRNDGTVTQELIDVLFDNPRYELFGVERDELARLIGSNEEIFYADLVEALFDGLARRERKRFAAEKTPGYVLEIALLHTLWPRARFVHLIRDGRDVALSILDWTRKHASFARRFPTWNDDRVTTAALWWKLHVRVGRADGRGLDPRLYRELRYERLVAEPQRMCKELCDFLGVRFEETMLRFYEGRTVQAPGLSAKHAWLPVTSGLRDWRQHMSREDARRFEAAAGELLEELGYERSATRLTRVEATYASRVEARFLDNLPARMSELVAA